MYIVTAWIQLYGYFFFHSKFVPNLLIKTIIMLTIRRKSSDYIIFQHNDVKVECDLENNKRYVEKLIIVYYAKGRNLTIIYNIYTCNFLVYFSYLYSKYWNKTTFLNSNKFNKFVMHCTLTGTFFVSCFKLEMIEFVTRICSRNL